MDYPYPFNYPSNASVYQDASVYGKTPEHRYYTAVAMTPHQRNPSSESYSSYDSGYGSGTISPTGPSSQPHSLHTNYGYGYTSHNYQDQYGQNQYTQDQYPRNHGISEDPSSPESGSTSRSNKKPKFPSSKAGTNGSDPKLLTCLYSRCEYTTLRLFDLKRHQQTKHSSGQPFLCINCPEGWCGRHGTPDKKKKGGFSRVDHFREHVRNVHHKKVVKDHKNRLYVEDDRGKQTLVDCGSED